MMVKKVAGTKDEQVMAVFIEMHTKNGKNDIYVFTASSRQLVLWDGLTIDTIRNGFLQGNNMAVSRSL